MAVPSKTFAEGLVDPAIGAAAGSAAGKGTGEVVNPKPGDKARI